MKLEKYLTTTNIVLFVLVLLGVFFAFGNIGRTSDVITCDSPGRFCKGTGELWQCDQIADGSYVPALLESCDDGYICDSKSGDCNPKHECAETTVPIWYIAEGECHFNEFGHGCLDPMGDGVTTFGTEAACDAKLDEKQGFINIVPPEGSTGYYIFGGVVALLITGALIYFVGNKKKR